MQVGQLRGGKGKKKKIEGLEPGSLGPRAHPHGVLGSLVLDHYHYANLPTHPPEAIKVNYIFISKGKGKGKEKLV